MPWADSFPDTNKIALQPSQVSAPVCARTQSECDGGCYGRARYCDAAALQTMMKGYDWTVLPFRQWPQASTAIPQPRVTSPSKIEWLGHDPVVQSTVRTPIFVNATAK